MTESLKALQRNCSSDHQFLFCRTEKTVREGQKDQTIPAVQDDLAKQFPGMLTGASFLEKAMERVSQIDRFGALVIRIDPPESTAPETGPAPAAGVAETIQRMSEQKGILWGWIDAGVFGCIFPGADEADCSNFSDEVKADLKAQGNGSVTIGLAWHPTLDFPKNRILDNARKALDHAGFLGPGSVVSFDAVSMNISADQFYQEGDIDGAVEEFKKALSLDPDNVNVHNSLGVCYGVKGDYERAAEEFKEAARIDPCEVMSVHNLGLVCLMDRNNREKALSYFLAAEKMGGDLFEVAYQAGKLYLEIGEPDKGRGFLEKATALKPASGVAHRYLGDCHAALDRTDAALAAYRKAVKLNPNDADALSALGTLMDSLGENAEVTTAFCAHSVAIAPENGLFRHRLGNIYLKQKLLEEALAEFLRAQELGHDAAADIEKTQSIIADQNNSSDFSTLNQDHVTGTDADHHP